MFNVALIGCGYFGQKLKGYIERHPKLELKAVCNSKTDLNEIYDDKGIDGVIIATPPDTHYSICGRVLDSGKHVLCEKPFTLRYDEGKELIGKADKAGLGILVDYTWTFSRSLRIAQQLVNDGEIGGIQSIEAGMNQYGRFNIGGVYWCLATHLLAITDMFTPILFSKCKAKTIKEIDGEVRDAEVALKSADLSGVLSVSTLSEKKERYVIIRGEHGKIVYDGVNTPSLSVKNTSGLIQTFYENENDNLKYVINHFVKMLRGEIQGNADMAMEVTGAIESII